MPRYLEYSAYIAVLSDDGPNSSFRQHPWASASKFIMRFRHRVIWASGMGVIDPTFSIYCGFSGDYPNFSLRQLPPASVRFHELLRTSVSICIIRIRQRVIRIVGRAPKILLRYLAYDAVPSDGYPIFSFRQLQSDSVSFRGLPRPNVSRDLENMLSG